uniref:Macrocin O-methyltransferase n=1 Tax=Eiseniibacteriota bacterium TaxID=2212470 RepID=A0A832MLP4_UNCEI
MALTIPSPPATAEDLRRLYLDLLKRVLTRYGFGETVLRYRFPKGSWKRTAFEAVRRVLALRHLELVRTWRFDPALREEGRDWPQDAETMIGMKRLNQLQEAIEDVLARGVPGDLVETGVWRGGSIIFMRAVLRAHGDMTRTVWAADSFQGLPRPDAERYPADRGDKLWSYDQLAVSLEEVRANVARYGLLDERVRFLKGWFKDTLPGAPIERLAVLRLDGDLYESTMDALDALYPRLSPGGYCIVDDYGVIPACRQAVEDYRARHGVTEPIRTIDWSGVYWIRRG